MFFTLNIDAVVGPRIIDFLLMFFSKYLFTFVISFDAMSCVYAAVRLSKLVTGRHFKDVL